MNEKKDNHIEYNKKNKNTLKIISDLDSNDAQIGNISKNYSIEETIDSKNLNANGIDINALKSIRLSQTLGSKELDSQILLDGMAGIKPSNQININNKKKDEINIIKDLYKENTNNKNINTKKNINYKEEEIIYIKEYENNESDNYYGSSQESEKMNYEVFIKYRENNKLLKQQNELFIEMLDSNNNKYNKRNRNIIISNLNEDLNYFTVDQDAKTELKNNKDNINTKKFKSLKNFKNKVKNVSINKTSARNKKSKKYSINEKIYEYKNDNKRNNNKMFNKLVNINSNEMNKNNINSLKMKNDLFYFNNKFIKYLNSNKESKNKLTKNENSYKYNIKNNIKKKISINIINVGPNLKNKKYNLKRNKSVKSVFNKNNLSNNSSKDYKIIKKTVKNVDSTYNHKQKEKKTYEDEKSFNNKNIKIKYIPIEFKKYCFNRNLNRKVDDNNNITYRNIKKYNINSINIEKSYDSHKNTLNNASITKNNSSYFSFKNKNNQNCKINNINKIHLNKNK